MGDKGIDARQVADKVQMDVARLDGFPQTLPEPVKVGLHQFPFHDAEFFLVPENAIGQVAVIARKSGNSNVKIVEDPLVVQADLLQAFLGKSDPLAYPFQGQGHEVPVDNVADVFEVARCFEHGHVPCGTGTP